MFDQEITQVPGVAVGVVAGVDGDGRPQICVGDDPARSSDVVWMGEAPPWKECVGLRVAVAWIENDERRPIVLGLLDDPPRAQEPVPETLRVESRRELIIECGKSKIALRADGRIEIRGGHLVSRSSGPNKIKGASVHIN